MTPFANDFAGLDAELLAVAPAIGRVVVGDAVVWALEEDLAEEDRIVECPEGRRP